MTAGLAPLALLGALLVGATLGLLGSGGSILTVPVLVYLADQPEKVAIAGSLLIVGAIALVGAIDHFRHGRVSLRHLLWFGVPGMIGTWVGAVLSAFVPGTVQLFVFALVMVVAAVFMLRGFKAKTAHAPAWTLALNGVLVGAMTGFVGVGGGFLIVPALVFFGGLAMHDAVGTSLAIIVLNTLSGFIKHFDLLTERGLALDWKLITVFVAIGIIGSLVGARVGRRLPQQTLRKIFAIGVLAVAGFIGWQTLPAL